MLEILRRVVREGSGPAGNAAERGIEVGAAVEFRSDGSPLLAEDQLPIPGQDAVLTVLTGRLYPSAKQLNFH